MTITPEQLDELERLASDATDGPWQWNEREGSLATQRGTSVVFGEPTYEGNHRVCGDQADIDHIAANSPDVTLQLVAIARAALAWRDARLARQAVQTRAGLAETSSEHHAAMRELPSVKEADVLACIGLMSALEQP